jgi:hypothetical protein
MLNASTLLFLTVYLAYVSLCSKVFGCDKGTESVSNLFSECVITTRGDIFFILQLLPIDRDPARVQKSTRGSYHHRYHEVIVSHTLLHTLPTLRFIPKNSERRSMVIYGHAQILRESLVELREL